MQKPDIHGSKLSETVSLRLVGWERTSLSMPLTKLVQKAKHGTKLGVGQLHSWDSYCQKEKIGEARYMASFDHFLAGLALAVARQTASIIVTAPSASQVVGLV